MTEEPPKLPEDSITLIFNSLPVANARMLANWLEEKAAQERAAGADWKTPSDVMARKIQEMLVQELGRDEYQRRWLAFRDEQSELRAEVVRYDDRNDTETEENNVILNL